MTLMKRPVRSRMRGVVGAGGEQPPATRFRRCLFYFSGVSRHGIPCIQ